MGKGVQVPRHRPVLCRGHRRPRSEEHTSELQSQFHLVCRLLLKIHRRLYSTLFPYTTLFRSYGSGEIEISDTYFFDFRNGFIYDPAKNLTAGNADNGGKVKLWVKGCKFQDIGQFYAGATGAQDRKSTRLNSSHSSISYAVFCLKYTDDYILHSFPTRRSSDLMARAR